MSHEIKPCVKRLEREKATPEHRANGVGDGRRNANGILYTGQVGNALLIRFTFTFLLHLSTLSSLVFAQQEFAGTWQFPVREDEEGSPYGFTVPYVTPAYIPLRLVV